MIYVIVLVITLLMTTFYLTMVTKTIGKGHIPILLCYRFNYYI